MTKKQEDYLKSYKNEQGQEIIISQLSNEVLMSTYRYLQGMVRRYKDIQEGVVFREKGKPDYTIKGGEEIGEIIKEYEAIKDALKFEIVLRKLLMK